MKKELIFLNSNKPRLDAYLAQNLPEYSRSQIQKAILKGGILVNGEISKSNQLLKENDKINIEIPPAKPYEFLPNPNILLDIVYEDNDVLVINKPAGLQVHPGLWQENNTLTNALIAHYPDIKNVGDSSIDLGKENLRPGLVHRLDKETSGLLIIAKNQPAYENLKNQFKNHQIQKKYFALVVGEIKKDGDVINQPIGRSNSNPSCRTVGGRNPKNAETHFKVIDRYKGYTLLEVSPKTGRMHQIRVHLAWYSRPVAGDAKYQRKKPAGLNRHFLHAFELSLTLPNGQAKTFSAPLPTDLEQFLKGLEKY